MIPELLRLRTALSALAVMPLAACLDDTVGPHLLPGKAAVSNEGGNFEFENGDVTFDIPPGAVKEQAIIGVESASLFPNDPRVAGGTVFDFTPDGLQFDMPVTVSISYDPASLAPGVQESWLGLFKVIQDEWIPVLGSAADPQTKTVSGEITSFSVYGVLADPELSGLSFTVQPSNAIAGAPISPAVQVAIVDERGNRVTTSSSVVTIALGANPGEATLAGTRSVAAVNGLARFADLQIDKAGQAYTLVATSGDLTATSARFDVSARSGAQVGFVIQPAGAAACKAITPPVQVAVLDELGNVVTSAVEPITVSLGANPAGATLSGELTIQTSGGVARFNDLSLDRAGVGYTLIARAASSSIASAASQPFTISRGASALIEIISGDNQRAIVGRRLPQPLEVMVRDDCGGPLPGVVVSWGATLGGGEPLMTNTVTDEAGFTSVGFILGPNAGVNEAGASTSSGAEIRFNAFGEEGTGVFGFFDSDNPLGVRAYNLRSLGRTGAQDPRAPFMLASPARVGDRAVLVPPQPGFGFGLWELHMRFQNLQPSTEYTVLMALNGLRVNGALDVEEVVRGRSATLPDELGLMPDATGAPPRAAGNPENRCEEDGGVVEVPRAGNPFVLGAFTTNKAGDALVTCLIDGIAFGGEFATELWWTADSSSVQPPPGAEDLVPFIPNTLNAKVGRFTLPSYNYLYIQEGRGFIGEGEIILPDGPIVLRFQVGIDLDPVSGQPLRLGYAPFPSNSP